MKKTIFKILLFLFLASAFFASGYAIFYLKLLNRFENKVTLVSREKSGIFDTLKSLSSSGEISLKGQDKKRINILLLGMAGKGKPGQNLTDTVMVASLDTENNRVGLISIPRDFYAEIPNFNFKTKINSAYQFGLNNLKEDWQAANLVSQTVSEITGLDLHYWIILNFDGFVKAVDSIGGINIQNERDIYDPRYPGPNYSYETFELKKGFHQLDGATALKYVRERHNDPEGDFGRAKRQQQVMQAAKNKVFSAKSLLNPFSMNEFMEALGDNLLTNISPQEIGEFISLSQKLDTQNINNAVLSAWESDSLLKVTHVFYGDTRAFALIPRTGNLSEIHELSENIFDLNVIKKRKEAVQKEEARVAIIDLSGENSLLPKIQKLLKDSFGYKNVSALTSPKKEVLEKSAIYDFSGGQKPFTLDELSKRTGAGLSNSPPAPFDLEGKEIDILIVLGKDLVWRYNMEEADIEEYRKNEDANEYQEFLNQN